MHCDPSGAGARRLVPANVLDLGERLVSELGLEDSTDTLGRWMAHYIAQLIEEVREATPVDRPSKEKACAEAILELWRHRHDLPHGRGHFEPEPLLRAIASLDPEAVSKRYFAPIRRGAAEDSEVEEWLQLADGIEFTARMLIVQCLVEASAEAGNKMRAWIAMAEAAGIEEDAPTVVFRFVNDEYDAVTTADPDEARREELQNRIKRLREFARLAKMLESRLRARLQAVAEGARKSVGGAKPAKRRSAKTKRGSRRPADETRS